MDRAGESGYAPHPVMVSQQRRRGARPRHQRSRQARGWAVHARGCAVLLVCALVASLAVAAVPPQAKADASTVATDRARISQIEQDLTVEGARIQRLVGAYDRVQRSEGAIRARLGRTASALASDRGAEAVAAVQLRRVAVDAYVSGGSLHSGLALLGASSPSADLAAVYIDVAGGSLQSSVTTFEVDRHRAYVAGATLQGERLRAAATLRRLSADRRLASAAVAADEAMLRQVKGNVQALLAAAYQREIASRRSQELALAARASQQAASSPPPVTPATAGAPVAAPGAYANPLRAVGGLSPERIDQGVDYSGFGPIYAIGDGVVLSTSVAGWPGGTFISYRLTDGPAAGLVVYAAEDIEPLVQVGQAVTPATVLGTVYEGPDGIETGWSDPAGQGWTMAHDYGQFSGGNSTAFGANFSQLLQSLGAPGGILQNSPPTGALPAGLPGW